MIYTSIGLISNCFLIAFLQHPYAMQQHLYSSVDANYIIYTYQPVNYKVQNRPTPVNCKLTCIFAAKF